MTNKTKQLPQYIKLHTMDVETFLSVAIAICKEVHVQHTQKEKCLYLTPQNILINTNHKVEISLKKEAVETYYRAPEQVVNDVKHIDTVSDIYVLGMIFYEMLVGTLPFNIDDPLEFSHTLVTQNLPFISDIQNEVPLVVSQIIEKMTAIDPLKRYRDLLSVAIDFSKVLEHANADDESIFQIDTFSSIADLQTNDVIYGREEELAKLQYIINSKGVKENKVVLLYGKSGAGKSLLVKTLVEKNEEHFTDTIHFKLEYGEQIIPYQLLYTALRHKTKQILAKHEKSIVYYKNRLEQLLGEDAHVLMEVIPELELIMGKQKVINDKKGINLDILLVRFMELFEDTEKPLCIYIDDIQWADKVTIDWIKNVILKLDNIIIFMTYRDEDKEVVRNALFATMLFELNSYDIKIDELEIAPMSEEAIETLIDDIMHLDKAKEVANRIYIRTKGNPFFVKQYVKQLHKDEVLWFDMQKLVWQCDLSKLDTLQISDNVFDMLSKTIGSLDADVRKLLCIASCMGNTFSHALLCKVFNQTEKFENSLSVALSAGWIVRDSVSADDAMYRFLHDKMQQTIHTFLLGKMALKVHFKIGCHLEKQREYFDSQNLMVCVNHLNIGSLYVRNKNFLGQMNQEAASVAKRSGDFESALNYIKKAMELNFFESSVEESVEMLKLRAECEHLCNHSKEAITYYEKALELSNSPLQKGAIYELLIKLYSDISQFKKAYKVATVAMNSFGIDIPKQFIPPVFIASFLRLKLTLSKYQISELAELPEAQDESFKVSMRILANTLQAAYQIRPELAVSNALIMVGLCLKNGVTKESVIGFTVFGVIFQGAILGNHRLGYDYSQLSFKLLKRFENRVQHAEVKFVCGYFSNSWKQSAIETEAIWNEAFKDGLEIGDWFHTGCAAAGIAQSMFMRGVPFDEILEQIKYFEKILLSIGAYEQHGAILSVKQALVNLKGESVSLDSFENDSFDENAYIDKLYTYESEHFAHYYFINKMMALYVHQAYKKAFEVSQQGKKFAKSSKGMLHNTEAMFYHALILAQLYAKETAFFQLRAKKYISATKKKFMRWEYGCKENFVVRYYLLEAESCRIAKEYTEAFSFYEKAIASAQLYGQVHLLGISNRLMSELYLSLGQKKSAMLYREDALESFAKWGMLKAHSKKENSLCAFDVNSLMKASQVIAREYEFSSLLQTLIRIIIENAGAQHGYLLLEKEGEFFIQAIANEDNDTVEVMQNIPYKAHTTLLHPVLQYVLRTKEAVVIDDMTQENIFESVYSGSRVIRSVLCAPLILQGELKGMIYLENNLLPSVFTEDKVQLLQHLSGQIIISIENTVVYNDLEQKVKQRTRDLEATKDELKYLATTDSLTKLYNRRYFTEVLENHYNLAKREDTDLSLMMLDIDDFKNVNDTYGHQMGDAVIVSISNILVEHTRKSDIVCRFGGEEFIVLLPRTNLEGTINIAETIRDLVERRAIKHEDNTLKITVSIGVSEVNKDENIEKSIKYADDALYKAKEDGKNRVVSV